MSSPETNSKPLVIAKAGLPTMADTHRRSQMTGAGLAAPAAGDPPGLSAAPTFTGLIRALGKRWFFALTTALLVAAATVLVLLNILPQYSASARVEISSKNDPLLPGMSNYEDPSAHVIFKGNQAALVKSPLVLNAALNQVKDLNLIRQHTNPASWLELALKTDFTLGPEIMRVTLSGDDPEEVAKIVNAVVDAYMVEVEQREKNRRQIRKEQLKENYRQSEENLRKLRLALHARQEALKIGDKETTQINYQNAQQKLTAVEKDLLQVKLLQISAIQELKTLKEREQNLPTLPVSDGEILAKLREDPRAKPILDNLALVQKAISDFQRVAPQSSQVKSFENQRDALMQELKNLGKQLEPELAQVVRAKMMEDIRLKTYTAQEKISSLKTQEELLIKEQARLAEEVQALSPGGRFGSSDVAAMRDNVLRTEAALADLGKAIALENVLPLTLRVSLLQRAEVPLVRDTSRQLKIAGAAGMGMFALVLFGIAFMEFRTRKIMAPDQVSAGLGIHVVGTLPDLPTRARKAIAQKAPTPDPEWQNQLNEAVDGLRTMLLHSARSDDLHVVMVTSAVGGEGKTSLASQLASSLARAWRKTLLIDADMRRPAAHKLFSLPLEPGLSEVLRGEVNVTDAIQPTPVSRLWFLSAGNGDSHALQALAQDSVRGLFDQLKKQYDFIIIDSCPVLPVADALLLGQHVDGVLFSILRDVSRAPTVYAAQQRMSSLGIRTLGAVVLGAKNELGKLAYSYA